MFFPSSININFVAQEPRSAYTSVVDKLYRSTEYNTPEFGEEYDFTQRYSGFFVPPMSSLYTFNIQSDDLSRLYFSPNASTGELLGDPVISISQWTRNRYLFKIIINTPRGRCSNNNQRHTQKKKEDNKLVTAKRHYKIIVHF